MLDLAFRDLRFPRLGRRSVGGGAVETLPLVQTAAFGAKTAAGAGVWKPRTTLGNPVDVATYDGLVSGSLGAYAPSISGGGLRFTGGGTGAPNGAVLNVTTTTGAQVTCTIETEANAYSAATLAEANTAYGGSVLGDMIRLRAGDYNPTAVRTVISRAASPSGTWTGTAALSDGNWVVLTRDTGASVTIGAIEVGSATTHPRYLRLHDLDFVTPLQADSNGIGTGISVNVLAQVYLFSGSHLAVTDCRFTHTSTITSTTTGAFRAINMSQQVVAAPDEARWIEGNTINGALHGLIGSCRASVIRGNDIRRVLADCLQLRHCTGLLVEGNTITDKLYSYTELTPTAVTRGASTIFTVADATAAVVNEPIAFTGFGGDFGAAVNGKTVQITAKTATTITASINTSAVADWDGLSGTLQAASALHGDFIQFNENLGATATQNNVTIRANLLTRGASDANILADGQGVFAGNSGTTAARDGWLIEGNIYVGTLVHGIFATKLTNSIIRSNTVARVLGIDASVGGSQPTISTDAAANTVEVADNIACAYSLSGTSITSIGNETITLTNNDAVPADAANVATYEAAFDAPVTVPNTSFDPVTAFATRMDGGSVFPGPIYPGATPYMDFDTLVYSDPRP
jgi:hypothetical protein